MKLFQNSGNLMADEMEVYETSIDDVNEKLFFRVFQKGIRKNF